MEKLDETDLAILQELGSDGRLGWSELADRIGLSLTPTIRRVRRLESSGYILGYAALFDDGPLGQSLNAVVTITLESQSSDACSAFEEQICAVPEVSFCGKLIGNPDYILQVFVPDTDKLEKVLSRISALKGIDRLRTCLVRKVLKRRQSSLPNSPPCD